MLPYKHIIVLSDKHVLCFSHHFNIFIVKLFNSHFLRTISNLSFFSRLGVYNFVAELPIVLVFSLSSFVYFFAEQCSYS